MELGYERESLVLIGPPASGKSALTRYLSEYPRTIALKGSEVRPDQSKKHEIDRDLVPDELFVPALNTMLSLVPIDFMGLLVVENIPRTAEQARVLIEWFRENNISAKTILFHLTEEQSRTRMLARQICSTCKETYYSDLKPPRVSGFCDKEGAFLTKRPGDRAELIAKAYAQYLDVREKVLPQLANYGQVYEIDTSRDITDVVVDLSRPLGSLRYNVLGYDIG